jgi:hypothetical protein
MFEYFFCLDILLLSRLHYLRHDRPLGWRSNAVQLACQSLLVAIIFQMNVAFWLLMMLLIGVAVLTGCLERKWPIATRLLSLLTLLLGIDILVNATTGLRMRSMWQVAEHVAAASSLFAHVNMVSGLAVAQIVFGMLLLLNEVNAAIRCIFQAVGIEPRNPDTETGTAGKIDHQELNAGRVIGFLERWLVYIVILSTNDLQAIGLIVAAKSLARMKQMDEKPFAEYVLIGTFLSVLSAVLIGKWVRAMIG